MSFSINTNISAMTANLNSNLSNSALDRSIEALSSGSALSSASYDASGLTIADQLSAQVAGLGQAAMNTNESIGMIQIADGALQGVKDNLDQVRVLTLKASNGSLNDSDRVIIQKEIDSLLESSNDIVKSTSYNGINLLDGTGGSSGDGVFVTQSGSEAGSTISTDFGNLDIESLLGTIDVTTEEGLANALENVDSALSSVSEIQVDLGAAQNQLASNISNISVTQINVASAESQIRDIDFAAESANFSQQNLLSQIDAYVQSQANASRSNVLRLLQ